MSGYAAGMRVVIRDAEWVIKTVTEVAQAVDGTQYRLDCIGISAIVRGLERSFYTHFESSIEILRPQQTRLVRDPSSGFKRSLLFMDSLLRRSPPLDAYIHVAQNAAMDVLPYQLKPTIEALYAPRPRILIADAVGIGKTLEAGILVSELVARGRGKRILVITVKAMLEQFQKEFWNRFSIALKRLDSEGLNNLESRIPSGHNPFVYVDRSIISIDTLKQEGRYRSWLENAYWDIIVIDEAHNVAERSVSSGSVSQRSRLARVLSSRSDALIMLSATPHDGRPESFASLIDMLDPTVIADKSCYTPTEIFNKGLVVRRFKGDIQDQSKNKFLQREVQNFMVQASDAENDVFAYLHSMTFKRLDKNHKVGTALFKTTLMKSFFSSPAAALATATHRIQKLQAMAPSDEVTHDLALLTRFHELVQAVDKAHFSKYQHLVKYLKGEDDLNFGWSPNDARDRLVIFTESRQTLDFLVKNLPMDLGLKANQVVVLKGDDRDTDLLKAVENFNQVDQPVRLMLATDVASEGLNLHSLCHRLIHFDIPWSLMTFQQRNGRVDRYGQTKQPLIRYYQTVSHQTYDSFGDAYILARLTEKDARAQENIDDPHEFKKIETERQRGEVSTYLKVQKEVEAFDPFALDDDDVSNPALTLPKNDVKNAGGAPIREDEALVTRDLIFNSDYDYLKRGLEWRLEEDHRCGRTLLQVSFDDKNSEVLLMPPADLMQRLKYLPREVLPRDGQFRLSSDRQRVQKAIIEAADNPNSSWPELQLLWELHPVVQWVEDMAISSMGRHSAPILTLSDRLGPQEVWFLLQGGYPNLKGNTPIHMWRAIRYLNGQYTDHSLRELMERIDFTKRLVNGLPEVDDAPLKAMLPTCVEVMTQLLNQEREKFEVTAGERLTKKCKELEDLHQQFLMAGSSDKDKKKKRLSAQQIQDIKEAFDHAKSYVEKVYTLDTTPFIQVVGVFSGLTSASNS